METSRRTRWLPRTRSWGTSLLVLATALGILSLAWAQSGTRPGSGTILQGSGTIPQRMQSSAVRPAVQPSFEQRFWDYLQAVRYQNGAPLPGKPAEMYAGEGPHGAFLKLYANRVAAGAPKELPHGSIVVKENYVPDRQTLMAISDHVPNEGLRSGPSGLVLGEI